MSQLPTLHEVRKILFVTFVVPPFHYTAIAKASLGLAHILARYFQLIMIFEAHSFRKDSIELITGDPLPLYNVKKYSYELNLFR
jgi:hypothetical protein